MIVHLEVGTAKMNSKFLAILGLLSGGTFRKDLDLEVVADGKTFFRLSRLNHDGLDIHSEPFFLLDHFQPANNICPSLRIYSTERS